MMNQPNRKQRRALKAAMRHEPRLAESRDLAVHAFRILERFLTSPDGGGNVLSPDHREALAAVLKGFAMMAYGLRAGRFAYPLDCGMGKTESVVAFVTAVHELGLPLSVVVAASRVESLAALYRRLRESGVPAERIGLKHSKKYDARMTELARRGDSKAEGFASLPSNTDAELTSRPFLLLTHERLRWKEDADAFAFDGKRRDLLVWDESLLTTSARAVTLLDVARLVGWLSPGLDGSLAGSVAAEKSDLRAAVEWLDRARARCAAELKRQEEQQHSEPRPIYLPVCCPEEKERYSEAVRVEARRGRSESADSVRSLFEQAASNAPVRVLKAKTEQAVVSFELAFPDHLHTVAVLDASFPLRLLGKLDASIRPDPYFREKGGIKRYSRVTGHFWWRKAGREAMEAAFETPSPREVNEVAREVVRLIREDIPPTEAVLLFTHKPHPGQANVARRLQGLMRESGIDPDATLPDGRPRFGWLCYGSETATNDYSASEHVVFIGALFRGDADLAAAIVGQRRDLLGEVTGEDVEAAKLSETIHTLFQGINRGACRRTENGEAKPMHFYVMHPNPAVRRELSKALPGMTWNGWVNSPLEWEVAEKLATYFGTVPTEAPDVTCRAAYKAAGVDGYDDSTRARGRELFLAEHPEWRLGGQRIVRRR